MDEFEFLKFECSSKAQVKIFTPYWFCNNPRCPANWAFENATLDNSLLQNLKLEVVPVLLFALFIVNNIINNKEFETKGNKNNKIKIKFHWAIKYLNSVCWLWHVHVSYVAWYNVLTNFTV